MNKLKLWNQYETWEKAEKEWDFGAQNAAKINPLKILKTLPEMPGITKETSRRLKWKALKYMILHDERGMILKNFFHRPLVYGKAFLKSIIKKKSYKREGDFFLYGLSSIEEFKKSLSNDQNLLVVGFSYCHKPFECPSGRFTDKCIHDSNNLSCRQCFIGKAVNALPEKNVVPLFIPTIHYIGEKIFDIVHANPNKSVLFIITACELTLEMFGDWGNMVEIKGIGVRLDGRICNTMKAFELSEAGIKPGLTVVLDETQKVVLNLIRHRRESI